MAKVSTNKRKSLDDVDVAAIENQLVDLKNEYDSQDSQITSEEKLAKESSLKERKNAMYREIQSKLWFELEDFRQKAT